MRFTNLAKVGGRVIAVSTAVMMLAQPALAQRGPVSKPEQKKTADAKESKESKDSKKKTRQQLQASTWQVITTASVPAAVMASKQRAFPKARITKAEQTGAGDTAFYRLSLNGPGARQVTFAADGTIK